MTGRKRDSLRLVWCQIRLSLSSQKMHPQTDCVAHPDGLNLVLCDRCTKKKRKKEEKEKKRREQKSDGTKRV